MPLVETNAAKHDISITLDVVPGLPLKRLWNCTVLAYGCQDHPVLTGAELSEYNACMHNGYSALPLVIIQTIIRILYTYLSQLIHTCNMCRHS